MKTITFFLKKSRKKIIHFCRSETIWKIIEIHQKSFFNSLKKMFFVMIFFSQWKVDKNKRLEVAYVVSTFSSFFAVHKKYEEILSGRDCHFLTFIFLYIRHMTQNSMALFLLSNVQHKLNTSTRTKQWLG